MAYANFKRETVQILLYYIYKLMCHQLQKVNLTFIYYVLKSINHIYYHINL